MDRGAWWATVYGVAKSPTQMKLLSTAHLTSKIFAQITFSHPITESLFSFLI